MGYIYKVTNSVNGKVYIGQTRRDVPTRWREHLYYSTHKGISFTSILHSAIRKYGEDAFTVETLEECPSDDLDNRETFWIAHYDSATNGYNVSLGGGGWQKCSDKDVLDLWDKGLIPKEIAEKLNVHPETVSKRLHDNGIPQDDIVKRGNKRQGEKQRKPVCQYDLDGNFLKEFPSLADAEASIGGTTIRFRSNAKSRTISGYQWSRYKTDNIGPVEAMRKNSKPKKQKRPTKPHFRKVAQFSMSGEYIRSYDSIVDAALATNGNKNAIQQSCIGKHKHSGGYQWRYFEDAEKGGMKLQPVKKIESAIPVHQYTLYGDYVASYDSINSAGSQFHGCGTGGIKRACDGEIRQSNGYRWSYDRVDKLPPMREDRSNRSVAKMDDNLNILKIYPKIVLAAKDVGVSPCSISSVCNCIHEKCAGFKWKYYYNMEVNHV